MLERRQACDANLIWHGGRLGWIVDRAKIQRDAVAAIQRGGGSAFYEWDFRDGVILSFSQRAR
jgi:hypothetical protein